MAVGAGAAVALVSHDEVMLLPLDLLRARSVGQVPRPWDELADPVDDGFRSVAPDKQLGTSRPLQLVPIRSGRQCR